MSKPVRINGVVIPPNKCGRKFKLETIMSAKEIQAMLLAGKEAGEAKAKKNRDEKLKAVKRK